MKNYDLKSRKQLIDFAYNQDPETHPLGKYLSRKPKVELGNKVYLIPGF
jgi:hypothetical protein